VTFEAGFNALEQRPLMNRLVRRLDVPMALHDRNFRILLHALIRSYLQLLGIRRTDPLWGFDLRDPAVADALRTGLDLLVTAACSGPLSKERTKEFWVAAIKIRRASGATTAQIATEAFNVLSLANLAASVDPLDVEEWVRVEMQRKGT
jgi:hypothetical protein